jgi:hypothetical protein
MNIATLVAAWAYACLAAVIVLVAGAGRLGRERVAASLVVLGLFMLAVEEPLLTLWLGLASPEGDRDSMATLITAQARAHVLVAALYASALMALLGWVAVTAFRRGELWAGHVLGWGWALAAVGEVAAVLLVHSRGLPIPGPGGAPGAAGFGWEPLAVGLLAWAAGLWLRRSSSAALAA